MSNMESGTPQEKGGTSHNQDGYTTVAHQYCIQVKRMLREISNHGQSIQKSTKYKDMGGHDSGDEDPNAWA